MSGLAPPAAGSPFGVVDGKLLSLRIRLSFVDISEPDLGLECRVVDLGGKVRLNGSGGARTSYRNSTSCSLPGGCRNTLSVDR